jgi:hypothetical protein
MAWYAGLILLATAFGIAWAGSPRTLLAYLQGDTLIADSYVDLGTGSPEEQRTGFATITNLSSAPIRLIGGSSDCSCTITESLPRTVEPWGNIQVPIRLAIPPETSGQFTRNVVLWTDSGQHPELRLRVGVLVK